MPTRRVFLASAVPVVLSRPTFAAPANSFHDFLTDLRAEAAQDGIRSTTLDSAFAGVSPNQKVLDRDRHQPEFTMTWARYRALVITDKRIIDGRAALATNRPLFRLVEQRYGVGAGVIAGIWGLESSFGAGTGDFHVVDALATLAWQSHRPSFFRSELIAALKILDHGDIAPDAMTGSYAGAMGQPQFMPSSYLRYAVDFDGQGRRNIWTDTADVLGSIANYLAQTGWRPGQTWGQAVTMPDGMEAEGRDIKRPLSAWAQSGIQPLSGHWSAPNDTLAGIVAPDGNGGDVFAVFGNFAAIRRYNPSDFYAIAVGLIGDQVVV